MKYSIIILLCFTFACTATEDLQTSDRGSVRFEPNDTAHDRDLGQIDADPNNKDTIDEGTESDSGGMQDLVMDADQTTDSADMNGADMMDSSSDAGTDTGPPIVEPPPSAITLTSTYFHADANVPNGVRAWAITAYPNAMPENARSTIFWGRFQNNACAALGYAALVERPLVVTGTTVFEAFYPECQNNYGPSVDAKVHAFGKTHHLLRSEVTPLGAFQSFGRTGQTASGANKYIQAVYTEFNPSWRTSALNRLRPWGGPSVNPTQARVAIRVKQSVTRDLLEAPTSQQLQQVIRFLVINEGCDPQQSSSFCQIELNFKTYNRGVGAYSSFATGDVFNDAAQGGLIAVVGPIASTGQSTNILGTSAWTSWGSATQLQPFQDKTFQIEMSWVQFQALLMNVTNNNPASVFGNRWNDRQAWIGLRIGYGQENYNKSANGSSLIEGLFESIEIIAL